MLFLVLVSDVPEFESLRTALREERQGFLDSIARTGRLLAEGTFVDGGRLMVIEAQSTNDAVAVLQADPFIAQPVSDRVQIREIVLNFVAPRAPWNGRSSGTGPAPANGGR